MVREHPFEDDRARCHHVAFMSEEPGIEVEAVSGGAAREETVNGLPVLAEVRPIERFQAAGLPAVQVAAAAATGFVAGAATVALVKRRSARKLARTQRYGPRRPVDMLPVLASRTFLVDVHLLARDSHGN
jgi:hypothetical protein